MPSINTQFLTLHDISKTFQRKGGVEHVLRSISVAIHDRSVTVVLGPSGCGKTTLLRIIAGLESPTAGTVLVEGLPPIRIRKAGRLGIDFQYPALLPWRDVYTNIALPLEVLGLEVSKSEINKLIDLVRLKGAERKRPGELSGGMAQRTALARSLVNKPDLLLLDEPFSSIDSMLRWRLNIDFQTIWLERNQPATVVVTHDIREAVFLADQILIMSERPASIVACVDISFPRPRQRSVLDEPEFIRKCNEVENLLESSAQYDRI